MATDTPLLTRVKLLAAAVETTTGTAATLGGSAAAMNVFNLKMSAEIPATERQGQASLSNLPPIPGPRSGKLTFDTEMYNAGSTPEWLATLLLGCGWTVNTGVYSPLSLAATTLTLGFYQGGSRLRQLAGAQGTFKISGVVGKPVMISWEFTGKWVTPSSVAMLTPTYPSAVPPRFAGVTLTLGGTAYKMSKMDFDMGNTVTLREDATDPSGYHSAIVTNRKPVFKFDPEAIDLSWYTAHLASTSTALNCVVGSGTGNVITLAAPALQLLNPPQDGDRNGILTDDLEFLATPSPFGSADTELTISPS